MGGGGGGGGGLLIVVFVEQFKLGILYQRPDVCINSRILSDTLSDRELVQED